MTNRYYGHWGCDLELDPDNKFGFIYKITNTVTGKQYIGKKQYWYVKKKPKKKVRTYWEKYTGSSKELNDDIKTLGKDKFKFEIIDEASSKGWLTYLEANYQHKLDVLVELTDKGERKFYNNNIGAVRFIPSWRLR